MSTIKPRTDTKPRVLIVGGGAAGMMAAVYAAEAGADVTIFEKNDRCGKKLRITGKGRCNVTNDCTPNEMLENVPTNPRFLYSALRGFSPEDTKNFFEQCGVPLKTERGRRVFPVSDKAGDIVYALTKRLERDGVTTERRNVTGLIIRDGRVGGVLTGEREFPGDAVIICTGGCSYPATGSDGSGYKLAVFAGHSVQKVCASLVPIVAAGDICARLQGLSLKNVGLRIIRTDNGKAVYEDFGEMMFAHFGLTGPMILSASAHIADIATGKYNAVIDLKPALDAKTLDTRLLSDFGKYINKDYINALSDLLPTKLIEPFAELTGIGLHKKVNLITKEERGRIAVQLKNFKVPLVRLRPIDEAIITRGGVSVKEINPTTMESKLVGGLYFAGEIIDVDAYTGGYNLQIAWSTGVAAGRAAAKNNSVQ